MNPEASDEYIQRLYKELDKPKPPPHLDQRILANAAEGSGTRWFRGFAVAATLVLGLSIGFVTLNQDTKELAPPTQTQQPVAEEQTNGFSLPSERQKRPQAKAPETTISFPKTPIPSGSIGTIQEPVSRNAPIDVTVDHSGADPYHDFGPGDWLTQIASLWENGDFDQAREAFVRFRQRFPDHPFPQNFPVSEASLLIDATPP